MNCKRCQQVETDDSFLCFVCQKIESLPTEEEPPSYIDLDGNEFPYEI